jgi:DNA-binding MarR family transcriptional regulator
MPKVRRAQTDAAEALIAVAPLVNRWIERLLAQHDPSLTVSQYLALRAIALEELTGAQLARRAGVSGPAISQLLTALVDSGLIERRSDPADRRNQTLALSSSGRRAYHSAEAELRRTVGTLLAEVPRPEADALARLLPHVEAALGGRAPPRKPPRPRKPPH